MLDALRQLWPGIVRVWERLSLSARVNIGLAVVATVVLILVLVITGSRYEYTDLYTGLEDAQEVAQMQAILTEEGIPYRLTDLGTTVQVPDRDAGRAMHVLSAQGVPTRHGVAPGWELLDQEGIFTSPEKHRTNVQRAIQGELQRMLNQLDFVDRSFVRVTFPEQRLLAREENPATATITLKVNRRPTKTDTDTVLAVVSTFAGANLDQSHITVATTDSQLLHSPTEDEVARVASTKHAVIEELERLREKKILDAFGTLGRKAIVKVSAKLDFSSKEVTEDLFQEGSEVSAAETTTELTSTESLPEGPPGAFSNLPEGVAGPTETVTQETTSDTVTNTEPSRTRSVTVTEPGDVMKYKVSAIIDWGMKPELDEEGNPTGEQVYAAMEEDEIENFRQFIANAVGPEVVTEDVHVIGLPFQMEQIQEARAAFAALEWAGRRGTLVEWGWGVLKFAAVVLLLLLARRWLIKELQVQEVEEEVVIPEPSGPSLEELRKQQIAEEVAGLSQDQPEAVASLLRAWMSEGEE